MGCPLQHGDDRELGWLSWEQMLLPSCRKTWRRSNWLWGSSSQKSPQPDHPTAPPSPSHRAWGVLCFIWTDAAYWYFWSTGTGWKWREQSKRLPRKSMEAVTRLANWWSGQLKQHFLPGWELEKGKKTSCSHPRPSNNASYEPTAQVQVRKTNRNNIQVLTEIDAGLQKTPADGMFKEACQST